jgi:hypothetical protein
MMSCAGRTNGLRRRTEELSADKRNDAVQVRLLSFAASARVALFSSPSGLARPTRMKHKPDQAFGHREVSRFFLETSQAVSLLGVLLRGDEVASLATVAAAEPLT